MTRRDRDANYDSGKEDSDRHSSSRRDKSSRKDPTGSSSSSKRDRDGDRDSKSSRSSKHSRDQEKGSKHSSSSSSSRKRDRSEDRPSSHKNDRSKERSGDRSRDDSVDRSSRDRDERNGEDGSVSSSKRRRKEEGSSRSSSSHKSKHRGKDRDGKSKHKDSDKEKERRREKRRSKDEHSGAEEDVRKTSNGIAANGASSTGEPPLKAEDMTDGEEEGELVFEPKKGSPERAHALESNGKSVEKVDNANVPDTTPPSEAPREDSPPIPVPLTDEQEEEAARMARIAARAEERAAERARARAAAAAVATAADGANPAPAGAPLVPNGNGRVSMRNGNGVAKPEVSGARGIGSLLAATDGAAAASGAPGPAGKLAFKTKKQREQEALQRLEEQRKTKRREQEAAAAERGTSERQRQLEEDRQRQRARETEREEARIAREKEKEMEVLRDHYLGKKKVKKKIVKPSEKFSKIFQFDWDASEDTSRDANPLYSQRAQLNASFGRGYLAGIDMREQRKDSAFLTALMQKRQEEQRRIEEADHSLTTQDKAERERLRRQQMEQVAAFSREEADGLADDPSLKGAHWSEKPLAEMAERDWRIFREDFDIRVKGGKAPLPLRFWEEGNLPSSVMEAIRDLGYEKPSPIQRQAIPIGMERRDIIGIAETGSGKTAAFGIPMIAYILSLDAHMRDRVAEQGPLALIMAPTRELALQIEEECKKFCKFAGLNTVCVVGGQNIEQQAFTLRKGVEIIIGTPGRLNDCVEKHYLVLNQCHYVVLDEADRMIDMGFEEQVLAVLDAMGGTLKADDEELAYKQELKAKVARNAKDLVRVTAMFSATMPPAVERMAKKYLRHPAVVQIGDEDTGKNRRIDQRVLWMTEAQKKTKVLEILRSHGKDDRVLVFINTKKSADMLGRQLEQAGFSTVVLHGGKTQDQREDNLESFREGVYTVLVATDVASRGLDIPDVKEVINYELPSKIETYCHRIGRTGRAGKDGIATSFLTEHDEEIMFGLKEYLQSTESHVPQQLSKHSAAQAAVGARREDGSLVNSKRDMVMFSKK